LVEYLQISTITFLQYALVSTSTNTQLILGYLFTEIYKRLFTIYLDFIYKKIE